jgi:sugar O-acyltransferase (sialic acid O-acetyltransferase NeuD family)
MEIILVGAGDMALEVEQYIVDCNSAGRGLIGDDYRQVSQASIKGVVSSGEGRLDDFQTRPRYLGEPANHEPSEAHYLIAIGTADIRRQIWQQLVQRGVRFATVIHPTCSVASNARIGKGTILCPFVFIGNLSCVGDNSIMNIHASAGHDTRIGPHCVLSPYACVNGRGELGEACFMGSQAVIAPDRRIGAFSKLATGAILLSDAPAGSLLAGNPAKGRKMFKIPTDVVQGK